MHHWDVLKGITSAAEIGCDVHESVGKSICWMC